MTKAQIKKMAKGYKVASVITNWLWELDKRIERLEKLLSFEIEYKDADKLKRVVWEWTPDLTKYGHKLGKRKRGG